MKTNRIPDNVRQIPLGVATKRWTMARDLGLTAIVDAEDYPALAEHNWCALKGTQNKTYYAGRRVPGGGSEYMHRIIMKALPGEVVDHLNHDTLDNRRINLKCCSQREKQLNRIAPSVPRQNTQTLFVTGYPGVLYRHRKKSPGLWLVRFRGEPYGSFDSAVEAYRRYCDLRRLQGLRDAEAPAAAHAPRRPAGPCLDYAKWLCDRVYGKK